MYVEKPETVKAFVTALKRRPQLLLKADVVIAPPFTLIPTLAQAVGKTKTIRIGAQTVAPLSEAKQTGGVSAKMLKVFGVSTVIIGHSERRSPPAGGGESDDSIREQIKRTHEAGMTAVLCVGETERDPHGAHFGVIERQLSHVLKDKVIGKLIVAYEPVWAIGKTAGSAEQPSEIQEMVIFIRKTLADLLGRELGVKVPILYGGSVEGSNAKELLTDGGVGGFLVGHASSEVSSFIEIITAIV